MDTAQEATATPLGRLVPIQQIKPENVVINHRLRRDIYNGKNQGSQFKSTKQQRVHYDEVPHWPLVNKFPNTNLLHEPTLAEALVLPDFVVLPDWWKFHVLRLNVKKRGERWKLDFNKDGFLAKDFTPHGAAAVVKDKHGKLRFPIWQGFQLHGDIGERLSLVGKYTPAQFQALLADPELEPRRASLRINNHAQDWCLGDHCPAQYEFPRDWDVLGELPPSLPPPNKKRKPNIPENQFNPVNIPTATFHAVQTPVASPLIDAGNQENLSTAIQDIQPSSATHNDNTGQPTRRSARLNASIQEENTIQSVEPAPTGNIEQQDIAPNPYATSVAKSTNHGNSSTPEENTVQSTEPAATTEIEHLTTREDPENPYATSTRDNIQHSTKNLSPAREKSNPVPKSVTEETDSGNPQKLPVPTVNTDSRNSDLSLPGSPRATMDTKRRAPKYAKALIPRDDTSRNENKILKEKLAFADAKIRALVKFGAHQDHIIGILASQFGVWKTDPDNRDQVEDDINAIIRVSEDAGTALADQFPSLESLVARHESNIVVGDTEELAAWLQKDDHIEFPTSEKS